MFQLAQDLGKTVEELSQMTSEEFTYWMAFYDYKNRQAEKQINEAKARRK
nr:hypothetical protein [Ningiella ruwaisensis]